MRIRTEGVDSVNAVDLVSVADIADMLGVSKQRASVITKGDGFPQPADRVSRDTVPVWRRAQVVTWARRVGRPLQSSR